MNISCISDSLAVISGSTERHVNEGSRLRLECRVERSSGPPDYVYWYRNGKVVNYSARKNLRIVTVRPGLSDGYDNFDDQSRRRRARLVSTLDIVNVTAKDDGGVYTCAPSNARNHSVVVHVVQGKITVYF